MMRAFVYRPFDRWMLAAALAASLLVIVAAAQVAQAEEARSATVNGEVDAERWKGIRLKRLPLGASLGVELEVDGPLAMLLLAADELRGFPAEERAAFSSRVVDRLRVSMKIPEAGDYFLILDNRAGKEKRTFTVTITAAPPASN